MPQGPASGTLGIEGEVEQPVKVSSGDLSRLKARELGAVLECSGNGTGPQALASNGFWEGWALGDVLALARPSPKAAHLHLVGRDGFARSVPVAEAGPDAMLVTRLNHEPLSPEHGAPWRALFPGRYGMNSVKWLEKIVLSASSLPPETDEYRAQLRTPSGRTEYQPLPKVLVKSCSRSAVAPRPISPGQPSRSHGERAYWSSTAAAHDRSMSVPGPIPCSPFLMTLFEEHHHVRLPRPGPR